MLHFPLTETPPRQGSAGHVWRWPGRSLLRDARGAVALEFAVLGPVFLLLIFSIFEVSLDLFMQEVLDNATRSAARLIRIGTITGSSYSTTLIADVCANTVLIPSCTTNLKAYVAAAATGSPAGSGFDSITAGAITGNAFTSSYATLAATDDVVLEVGYNRPWWFSWFASVTGESSGWLVSVVAFQTEPYFTPS